VAVPKKISVAVPKKNDAHETHPNASGKVPVAPPEIKWRDQPANHDYPAAAAYLSLLAPQDQVDDIVARLKSAPISHFRANDILRASGLPLLGADDISVRRDLGKQFRGLAWSPVLIVRGDINRNVHLTIADGYHRICASYHLTEDLTVPCKIVDLSRVS